MSGGVCHRRKTIERMGYSKLSVAWRAWVAQWVHPVVDCMLVEELLQFGKFVGVGQRQVHCLREVFFYVVQLPLFLWSIKFKTLQSDPRQAPMEARSNPALAVHGPVAKDLEVLLGVRACCVFVFERIQH